MAASIRWDYCLHKKDQKLQQQIINPAAGGHVVAPLKAQMVSGLMRDDCILSEIMLQLKKAFEMQYNRKSELKNAPR